MIKRNEIRRIIINLKIKYLKVKSQTLDQSLKTVSILSRKVTYCFWYPGMVNVVLAVRLPFYLEMRFLEENSEIK